MVSQEKIDNLGDPLGLSKDRVDKERRNSDYMETIANLMHTIWSRKELEKWIKQPQRSEKKLADLAERFGVSEEDMSKLIEEVRA